jgi:hypothetical protein
MKLGITVIVPDQSSRIKIDLCREVGQSQTAAPERQMGETFLLARERSPWYIDPRRVAYQGVRSAEK